MNRSGQPENRRQFLVRAAAAGFAALPFLMNCKTSGAPAQDTETAAAAAADVLSQIRKNARPRGTEGMGAIDAPDTVSWKTVLAKETDEGEPMIISGTIFRADGKTPAPDTLIYLYHTDMYGIYGSGGSGGGEHKHGRFRGWMLSDAAGRYEFRSIRPASYPNTTFAAHVHMTITGKNFREDWIDSILFEGDRFITAQERNQAGRRGGFNPIVRLEKGSDGAILRATRDIQLLS